MIFISVVLEPKWLDRLFGITLHAVYPFDDERCQLFVLWISDLQAPMPHVLIVVLGVGEPSEDELFKFESQIELHLYLYHLFGRTYFASLFEFLSKPVLQHGLEFQVNHVYAIRALLNFHLAPTHWTLFSPRALMTVPIYLRLFNKLYALNAKNVSTIEPTRINHEIKANRTILIDFINFFVRLRAKQSIGLKNLHTIKHALISPLLISFIL